MLSYQYLIQLFYFYISLFLLNGLVSLEVYRPRGVSLENASRYDSNTDFTCFDGSKTIVFTKINDDYCDCKDGSDEPGTSACDGVFYCNNIGHAAVYLPSSLVNDGVCDCCDGSDEYNSEAECVNDCRQLGAAAREEAERLAEIQGEGFKIRQTMIEQGRQIVNNKKLRIEELTKEKADVEVRRNQLLAEKESAEESEKAALDQYREAEEELKQKKDAEQKRNSEREARSAFEELDADKDGFLSTQDLQTNKMFDINKDGDVTESEVAFYFRGEEKIDIEKFIESTWALMRPVYLRKESMFTPPTKESDIDLYDEEQDPLQREEEHAEDVDHEMEEEEESDKEDDDEEAPDSTEEPTTDGEEEPGIVYDSETQALVDAANAARDAFRTMDDRLRDLNKEIESLKDEVEGDFGPDQEWRVLKENCFEFTDREYTYKLCPFNEVLQIPKSGGGSTQLGKWGAWAGPENNPFSVMKYEGGQGCWNGPQRSAKVELSCGVQNAVISATEPNRCEYLLLFSTPAMCSQTPSAAHDHSEL